ncbi:hypothetical protein F5X99DRAFT_388858 [Biscogniauxia marginata]|nr:hypothetical protein F5X99DRAFT_388858 [Biscogniauxia marginata]
MDHLILPKNPIHAAPKVEMREAEVYDGLDFATYPDRQGWRERSVEDWLVIFQRQSESFVAFLERWLLFGPLCAMFGSFCKPSDFVRTVGDSPNPMFTTDRFPVLLQQITDSIKTSDSFLFTKMAAMGSFSLGARVHTLLADAEGDEVVLDRGLLSKKRSLINFIDSYSGAIRDPRNPIVTMATSIMIESLFGILVNGHISASQDNIPNPIMNSMGDLHGLLWISLRQDGWCPSELARLFSQFNSSCLYFIYNLQRPAAHEEHHMIRIRRNQTTSASHPQTRLCTPFECTHRKIRAEEYQTKHADGCDGCHDVVADPEELRGILERGKIPLILSIEEDDKSSSIMFVEAEPWMAYVAISHVWSDGLGNLKRNALPRCQLLRLSQMVRSLPGESSDIILFWCDTICVPPDSAGMDDAQALALGQMRSIYADASTVLVLDSWLFNSTMKDKTHAEIIMKIFCCTWNTRLWTYQEGALARSLYFQFRDRVYNLDVGIQEMSRLASPVANLTVSHPLLVRYHSLRGFRKQQTSEAKLLAIAHELGHRTTSVGTDEALCLAVLLGLNAEEMARTEPSLRMEMFWRMLPSVPQSIVFYDGTTFDIDGLRWAPTTFLRSRLNATRHGMPSSKHRINPNELHVQRAERGVFMECAGIRILCRRGRMGNFFNVRDQNRTWYQILLYHRRQDGSPVPVQVDHGPSTYTTNPSEEFGSQEVAVLDGKTSTEANDSGLRSSLTMEHGANITSSILVAIDREEDGVIFCRRIMTCMTTKVSQQLDAGRIRDLNRMVPADLDYGGFVGFDKQDGKILIIGGRSTPVTQRWCIG